MHNQKSAKNFEKAEAASMQELLYLELSEKVQVKTAQVNVCDVAKITCRNQEIQQNIENLSLFSFEGQAQTRFIITALKIIEQIHAHQKDVQIIPLGCCAAVVEYLGAKAKGKIPDWSKILFVSCISFFGSAFTIMAFHTEIEIKNIFANISLLVAGSETYGASLLEITYSLGLGVGIILFFNHIGGRRITKDPTPIEVAMYTYEKDVNAALTNTQDREHKSIDVH